MLWALGCLNLVLQLRQPPTTVLSVAAPTHDSATAVAASQDSAMVATALCDRAVAATVLHGSDVVEADVGAPATRAATDRL